MANHNYIKNEMKNRELRKRKSDVKKLTGIIAAVICVGAVAVFIGVKNSPYNKLMKAISKNNTEDVVAIYDESIKGSEKVENKVKKELESQIDKLLSDYEAEITTYDDTMKKITFIESTKIISEKVSSTKTMVENEYKKELEDSTNKALEDFKLGTIAYEEAKTIITENKEKEVIADLCEKALEELELHNSSKQNFTEGMKLAEAKDYTNAVEKLKKVIKEDENYQASRSKIKELQSDYKKEIISSAKKLAKEKQYDKAAEITKQGLKVLKKDKELTALQTEYEEKYISKIRGEQKLKISYPGILVQHPNKKELYPDMLSTTITNDTNKVLTYYEVAFVAFDRDGKPLEIRYYPSGKKDNYVVTGMMEDLQIKPGESYGKGYGWEIYEQKGIYIVKACVIRAQFKDGSTWENAFYPYWKEMYAGKQYKSN